MITYPNAKINLGLSVLRRRNDGYHDLQSLFLPYPALTDELKIEEARQFSIRIIRDGAVMDGNRRGDWDPRKDLTVRAYELLRGEFDLPPVAISLTKRIPVGAGLGGGSADASFALRMLSEMFNLYLPDTVLEIFAATLGSDCPFFIHNRPMMVKGRGDILEPYDLPSLDALEFRVEIPEGISVSTKEAYAGIVPAEPAVPLEEALRRPVEEWKEAVVNDFETTVFAAHPPLAALKASLYRRGALYASMSGSGSALFGAWEK